MALPLFPFFSFRVYAFVPKGRDISWSIGTGTAEQLTLPFMLNMYHATNYSLEGMSTAAVLPKDFAHLPHNDYHPDTDHLNVAESEGAVHRGSMDEQWAFILEQKAKYHDLDNRWKIITIWMTANDVCGVCDGPMDTDAWATKTNEVLLNISNTFNKVYVNLISTLDLSNIARLQRSVEYCRIEHR